MNESPVQTTTPTAATPATAAETKPAFFNRRDKMAFTIASVVSFGGYFYTLLPSVGLEDSGEFLTAARHLGVPHPPGYPIWTIFSWIWQWIIPVGNIAWRVNLMSAFFAALAVGLAALLISKSGHVMAGKVGFLHQLDNEHLADLIILASSVSAALMLAFAPVMWSQAVITEVYALNAFFLLTILVLLYRWSFEPERRWRLYLAAFLYGVSLTNHQTLVLFTAPFPVFALFVWFVDKKLGRDMALPMIAVILIGILKMIVSEGGAFHEGAFSAAFILGIAAVNCIWFYILANQGLAKSTGLVGLAVIALMAVLGGLWFGLAEHAATGWVAVGGGLITGGVAVAWASKLWWTEQESVRLACRVLLIYLLVILGLGLYAYMYFSSSTNPPMNWGFCRTKEGFIHHFTRGQYEKVHTERTPLMFWGQFCLFYSDLALQFNWLFMLLPCLALFFYRDLGKNERDWLKYLLIAFVCLNVFFIFLSNPGFEKQKQFTDRVFFLPGHCLYAICIGYGLILGLGYLLTAQPTWRAAAKPIAAIVLLLPVVSFKLNWGENEERGHDFGYRFGYLMFKPGGGYPEMDRDAVLYGGTDPGRFVPTYMIFVESQVPPSAKTHMAKFPESGTFDRRDVYIITQNALADGTYMNYVRDHYDYSRPKNDTWIARRLGRDKAYPKEPIWISSEHDAQVAFQQYWDDFRSRPHQPGEDVSQDAGRLSVQGVVGVMKINGILTKQIFEHNKTNHAFYVEESYQIDWMYPYLEPYGIIMKINTDPLPGPDQDRERWDKIVTRDHAYWDALSKDLVDDPRFRRDDVAQKTFSKLRSAIGGVYAFRNMHKEAEEAYLQSIQLCPDSPEANFRLAQLYLVQSRFAEAAAVLERYQQRDPHNTKIGDAVNAIRDAQRQSTELSQLEQQQAAQPDNRQLSMQLVIRYAQRGRFDAMDALANTLLAQTNLAPADFLLLADTYAKANRIEPLTQILLLYTQRYPQDPIGWYNFAALQSALNNCDAALTALERALTVDASGSQVRGMLGQDARFNNCRSNPRFQQLLGGQTTSLLPGELIPAR